MRNPSPTVPISIMALLVLCTMAHGNALTDGLLIGCYRYVPGDCTGIYRVLPPIEPLWGGTLGRVVGGTRPVWSPDRTRFAYLTNDVIWIAEPDGNRRGGSIGLPLDGSPGALCWSRDGHYVLYTWVLYETQTTRYGIGRVAADTIGQRNWEGGETLLLPEGQGARWPAVSPDGRRLAWCGIAHDGASQTEATAICWIPWEDLRWGGGAGTPPPMRKETISRIPDVDAYRHQGPHWSPDSMRIGFDAEDMHTGLRTAWVADLVADSVDEITIGAHGTRSTSARVSVFFLGWLGDDDCLVGSGGFLPSKAYRVLLSEGSSSRDR